MRPRSGGGAGREQIRISRGLRNPRARSGPGQIEIRTGIRKLWAVAFPYLKGVCGGGTWSGQRDEGQEMGAETLHQKRNTGMRPAISFWAGRLGGPATVNCTAK